MSKVTNIFMALDMNCPGFQKGLWKTQLATSKKIQVPSWDRDTVHRYHGVGTRAPAEFSLQRKTLQRALPEHSNLYVSAHALSGAFQLPPAERELHNTHTNELQSGIKYSLASTPNSYLMGWGREDQVPFLSVLSVQGLEAKINLPERGIFQPHSWS